MGRILILLGIVAIIGGGIGLAQSIFQPVNDVLSNVSPEAIEAQAAALCNDGETLETTQGQETYSPSSGWGRPTYFYCVNAEGERREVTEEFGTDLIDNTMSTAMSAFSGAIMWVGISMLGVVLLIAGIISMVRSKTRSMHIQAMRYGGGSFGPNPIAGDPAIQWGSSSGTVQSQSSSNPIRSQSASADLTDRLQKLENARAANLISQEEYDRLHQSILNEL